MTAFAIFGFLLAFAGWVEIDKLKKRVAELEQRLAVPAEAEREPQ